MPEIWKGPDGIRRLAGRRLGQYSGTVLTCPDGHRQRVVRYGEHHFAAECIHDPQPGRLSADARQVVHWLYLLPGKDGGTEVVECHLDEVLYIARERLTLPQIRRFLELTATLERTS